MTKTKYRYHLSAYFSDFVEAINEDEAWETFQEMVANAKLRDFAFEMQDIEELDDEQ